MNAKESKKFFEDLIEKSTTKINVLKALIGERKDHAYSCTEEKFNKECNNDFEKIGLDYDCFNDAELHQKILIVNLQAEIDKEYEWLVDTYADYVLDLSHETEKESQHS